jgi:hypothetical protein
MVLQELEEQSLGLVWDRNEVWLEVGVIEEWALACSRWSELVSALH